MTTEEVRDGDDDVNGLGCGCLLVPHGTAIRRLCKWHEATTFSKTWAGFRAFLDEMYPDDIFPDKGRDLGPSFVVAARRLSEVESEVRSLRGVVQAAREIEDELFVALLAAGQSAWPDRMPDLVSYARTLSIKLHGALAAAADAPQPSTLLDEIGGDECGDLLPGDENLPLAANVDPVTEADREARIDRAERQR